MRRLALSIMVFTLASMFTVLGDVLDNCNTSLTNSSDFTPYVDDDETCFHIVTGVRCFSDAYVVYLKR